MKVNVYHSKSGSSPVLDTEMIAYSGGPPSDSDQNARKQCIVGTTTADSCSFSTGNPTPCLNSWAGIPNITLAPGMYVSIYSAAYYGTDSGPFQLNVYTTAAQ